MARDGIFGLMKRAGLLMPNKATLWALHFGLTLAKRDFFKNGLLGRRGWREFGGNDGRCRIQYELRIRFSGLCGKRDSWDRAKQKSGSYFLGLPWWAKLFLKN